MYNNDGKRPKVGVFYEVYGYKNEVDADYAGSLISDVARVCNLSICEKRSLTYNGAKVYLIGFRDVKLEKFKELLNAASYNVVTLTKQDNHEYKVDSLLPLANASRTLAAKTKKQRLVAVD